jgi:hypothetical protein
MDLFILREKLNKEKLFLVDCVSDLQDSISKLNKKLSAIELLIEDESQNDDETESVMAELSNLLGTFFSKSEVDNLIAIVRKDDVRKLNGKLTRTPQDFTHQALALVYKLRILNGNVQSHMKDSIPRLCKAGNISADQINWFQSQGFAL